MKYDLKKHNKPYSVEELAHLGITKETLLRPENQTKWIPAEQIEELSELLVEKPLSYTEIRKHYKNSYLVSGRKVMCLFFLMALTILIPPIIDNQLEGWHYIFIDWKVIVYTFLILVSVVFCIYDFMRHRYYRIIKKTKKVSGETEVTYEVQTGVSFKKKAAELSESEIKWRVLEKYRKSSGKKPRRGSFDKLEEAKACFDKKTVAKLIFEKPISEEKIQLKKPSIFQFLKEKNTLLYFNPVNSDSLMAIIGFVFLVFISGGCLDHGPEETKKIIIATPLLLMLLIYIIIKIRIAPTTTFLRVIKRRVKQGLYSNTSYHLQSSTTKNDTKTWKDINIIQTYRASGNSHSYTYSYIEEDKDKLMRLFYEKTRDMTPKVTEESIDA